MFKYADLFCGIGGFRIGFDLLNYECVFSSDIDKKTADTYELNFNENPLNDITNTDAKDIPDFDVLTAGFPCQPFSIAGHRKGFQDTRGTLFFDIERIISEKKPKAFLLENVKGLVNHDKGHTLKTILNTIATTINGHKNIEKFKNDINYHVYYKILNSINFGVPQNRERIYIIGFQEKVDFDFEDLKKKDKNLSTIIEQNISGHEVSAVAKKNILDNLKKKSENIDLNNPFLLAYEIRPSRCSFRFDGYSPCLTAKMGTGGNNIPVIYQQMRKFTTKECLLIQGFPKNFRIEENNLNSYKQIGNSVSVPLTNQLASLINQKIS
tara:strand:+ start:1262 stop:2233 length:972 start_codon:yes stop_codon:yes gene_type:complete